MNVPQFSHGYPSDARSSLWQDRQVIASRSRRIWRIRTTWVSAASGTPERPGGLNLHQGPHLTTRFAACNQVARRSGPASSQPAGIGASLRFSPSPSKHSQPLLYSLATSMVLLKGLFRRSGVRRRSGIPSIPAGCARAARRSILLLSAAAGVTTHTSHRLPVESRKVR